MPDSADGIISINGAKPRPLQEGTVSATDRGLLYGDCLYETMLYFNKRVVDFLPHMDRLRRSADDLEIPFPWSNEEILFEIHHTAEHLEKKSCQIRLLITRAQSQRGGLRYESNAAPARIIYATPTPQNISRQQHGLHLQVTPSHSLRREAFPKSNAYLCSIIAKARAEKQGFHDILWKNIEDELTESSTANIFFVQRTGETLSIATPSVKSGLLPGITRKRILDLLSRAGIPTEVRVIYHNELARFDEAFLCSSVRGLAPIEKIDGHTLYTLRKASTFYHIDRLYKSWLRNEA